MRNLIPGYNRTIEELKFQIATAKRLRSRCYNRTIEELKLLFKALLYRLRARVYNCTIEENEMLLSVPGVVPCLVIIVP
jgi:hypothetical protein